MCILCRRPCSYMTVLSVLCIIASTSQSIAQFDSSPKLQLAECSTESVGIVCRLLEGKSSMAKVSCRKHNLRNALVRRSMVNGISRLSKKLHTIRCYSGISVLFPDLFQKILRSFGIPKRSKYSCDTTEVPICK